MESKGRQLAAQVFLMMLVLGVVVVAVTIVGLVFFAVWQQLFG